MYWRRPSACLPACAGTAVHSKQRRGTGGTRRGGRAGGAGGGSLSASAAVMRRGRSTVSMALIRSLGRPRDARPRLRIKVRSPGLEHRGRRSASPSLCTTTGEGRAQADEEEPSCPGAPGASAQERPLSSSTVFSLSLSGASSHNLFLLGQSALVGALQQARLCQTCPLLGRHSRTSPLSLCPNSFCLPTGLFLPLCIILFHAEREMSGPGPFPVFLRA